MKKWIQVSAINTSNLITDLDADSIIGYGPQQGATAHSTIYLVGGQIINVTNSTATIREKIKNAK